MATKTTDLHHKVTGDSTSYERAMGRSERATAKMEREARKLERQQIKTEQAMSRVGTVMLGAGAAIAAGIGLSVRAAIQWETAWAGVVKTVDGSETQLSALEDSLRSMAQELPQSHAEIAGVAEAAGQLGVATEDVAEFTRVMINMGVATNMSSEEAAFALARMMNIMQTAPDDVSRMAAAIVDLGNTSATTEGEITAMALRIAGAGNTIGLTEADVVGFAAALSSVGIRAEAGGTAISRVFLEIDSAVQQGGDALQVFAQTAGMSAEEFAAAYRDDAGGAIAQFVTGLGRVQTTGGDVNGVLSELGLTEIRVSDALRRLSGAGDLLTDSLGRSETAWDENTALMAEAERRYATVEARMAIAKNQVNDFAISVGQTFLPAVGSMVDTVGGLVSLINELPGPLRSAIAIVAALTAGLLLAGGAVLVTLPRIMAFRRELDQLALSGGRAATAVGAVRTATSAAGRFMAGPWGAALAAGTVALGIWGAEQAAARRKVDELRDSLDAQTGSITDNTRLILANELAQHKWQEQGFGDSGSRAFDLVDALDELNIEMTTAVDAAAGVDDAQQRLQTRMEELRAAYQNGVDVTGRYADGTDEARESTHAQALLLDEVMRILDGYTGNVDKARAQQALLAESTGDAKSEMEALSPEARQLAGALELTGSETEQLTEQLDSMEKELSATFDTVFGLSRAQDELTEAFRKAHDQFAESEAGLEGNSEAAIENRRMAEELIETYAALVLETLKHTDSQEEAEKAAKDFEDELDRLEEQTGINVRELDGYNDAVSEIDRQVDVRFTQRGITEAERRARNLRHAIDAIPRRVDVNVNVHQAGTAPIGGRSIAHQTGGMVHGPPGGIDRVPARVTPGEFIVNREASQRNLAALQAINAGGGRLAAGGGGGGMPTLVIRGDGTARADFIIEELRRSASLRGGLGNLIEVR